MDEETKKISEKIPTKLGKLYPHHHNALKKVQEWLPLLQAPLKEMMGFLNEIYVCI